jgi:hypothetical protein
VNGDNPNRNPLISVFSQVSGVFAVHGPFALLAALRDELVAQADSYQQKAQDLYYSENRYVIH